MATRHPPSCARRLRSQAAIERWPVERTVTEIHLCCGVSLLRAHRLARGWTLRVAVDRFHEMCAEAGLSTTAAPKLDQDQLGVWETKPHRRPRASTVDLLCRLYRSNAQGLGLAGDYQAVEVAPAASEQKRFAPLELPRPRQLEPAAETFIRTPGQGTGLDDLVDSARMAMDRTLASASVTPGQLDLLDERLLWHRRQYAHTPPRTMLEVLLADVAEVRALAAERQPAAAAARLSEVAALLATLVADALMKLGRFRQSWAWYGTARTAADDGGKAILRARVRAQAAMLPYYYGPLDAAVALAREARLLARHRPGSTAAFAAAAEARALARQGDADGAEQAVRFARMAYEKADHGDEEDAFAFPERRLLLYLSGVHTGLAQTKRAQQMQDEALRQYAGHSGIDPALLHLESAICLAHEKYLNDACELAGTTYLQVPPDHRTRILSTRAQHVIEVLPPSMRSARAARELTEILTLPAGSW